jgi:hypothetical protein
MDQDILENIHYCPNVVLNTITRGTPEAHRSFTPVTQKLCNKYRVF